MNPPLLRPWTEAEPALDDALSALGTWRIVTVVPPPPWHGTAWSVHLGKRGSAELVLRDPQRGPADGLGRDAWHEIANWALTRALERSGVSAQHLIACGPPQAENAQPVRGDQVLACGFRRDGEERLAGVLAWWQR